MNKTNNNNKKALIMLMNKVTKILKIKKKSFKDENKIMM